MSTTEKTLYYASMWWLFAAVVLHVLHLIEAGQTVLMLTSGLGLLSIPLHRCRQRLVARNAELETRLPGC